MHEITRAEAERVLGALEEIVLEELGNAPVRVGGRVQLTVSAVSRRAAAALA